MVYNTQHILASTRAEDRVNEAFGRSYSRLFKKGRRNSKVLTGQPAEKQTNIHYSIIIGKFFTKKIKNKKIV